MDIIATATSTEVTAETPTSNSIEFEFVVENGNTGVRTISDPLLDTEARAMERAYSELLQNAYKKKEVRFSTYRTDMNLNDVVMVHGVRYIIKDIQVAINEVSIKNTIRAIRYE